MEKSQTAAENINNNPQEIPSTPSTRATSEKEGGEEDLISDFSSMFKKKGGFVRKPSTKLKNPETKTPNWLLEIPAKMEVSLQDLQTRRTMDNRKWMTIVKTADSHLKIVAAVCSCWNYLCSNKGLGSLNFMSLNKCKEIVEKQMSLQELKGGSEFSREESIKKVIEALNQNLQGKLKTSTCTKMADPRKLDEQPKVQRQNLLQGIQSNKCAYIYLAYEDILCPIGFDKTFLKPIEAYSKIQNVKQEDQELWIISSSLGRNQPSFCIKRWSDIQKDLSTSWPQYLDIRQAKLGVRVRPDATEENKTELRGNSNCIIKIQLA